MPLPQSRPAVSRRDPISILLSAMILSFAMPSGGAPAAEPIRPGQAEAVAIDIPAQPLSDALRALSRQTGLQFIADSALTRGVTAPAVSGTLRPTEALTRLLAGSGLQYRMTGANSITLERAAVREEEGPARLEPVTVTARRFETPISDVPAAITVIDRDEIQSNPAFGGDIQIGLGQTIPGASLSDARGGGVRIRGRDVSYRINGVELNQRGREANIAVQDLAPSAFESIDAVRGTDSTFGFGFDGGAINFRTPQPTPGAPRFTSLAGFDFQAEDLDDSLGYRLRQEVTGTWQRFGYAIGGGGRFYGGEFDPDGDPYPDTQRFNRTNADTYDVNGTFTVALDENQSLETTQYYFQAESDPEFVQDEPGDVAEDRKATSRRANADDFLLQENATYVSTYTYRHDDLWGNRLNLTGFYQYNEIRRAFDRPGSAVGVFDEDNERHGVRSSVQTPFWFLDDTLLQGAAVTWGVDYQHYEYLRTEIEGPEPAAQSFPGIEERLIAGHLQVSLPVGERIDLTGGLRHERGQATLDDIDEDRPGDRGPFEGGELDFDTTLYNAGLTVHLTDAVNVYGSFSQSAGLLDFGRGSVQVSRAEDLQPELDPTDQYEIGLRGDFEDWRFTAAVFYSESDLGQIFVLDPVTTVAVPLALPVEIWGVELTLDTRPLENLGLGGTFSYSEGEFKLDDGQNSQTVSISNLQTQPPKLTGYIDYTPFPWWRNRLSVTHQFGTDDQDDLIATGQLGGLALEPKTFVNFFARFEPGFVPGEIDLGIENLFNTREFDIAAEGNPRNDRFYLYPARTFSLAYRLRW